MSRPEPVPTGSRIGGPTALLATEDVIGFVAEELAREARERLVAGGAAVRGASVCVVIPDATRAVPLRLLALAARRALESIGVCRITFLVALGTHAPLSEEALALLVGAEALEPGKAVVHIDNHRWWEPSAFVDVGTIPGDRLAELSAGMLRRDVPVLLNRHVVDHDLTVIIGPVLPHEVVGFSGGNKYLFPGLSGADMIDVSHWLGALIGSAEIIGVPGTTPVRALIDEAAEIVPGERLAVCVVTGHGDGVDPPLHSVAIGGPREAWAAAVEVAAVAHVRHLDAPVRRVLSLVSERYDDLWTGAKGFYKVEPVVADGGLVVLHAPHITEVSAMHPGLLEIGYHIRDHLLAHWERYRDHPWGELAHSTHLRGAGTWDPVDGEQPRVRVALATGIPHEVVESVGLEHIAPDSIDIAAWEADPDTLVVHDAGEDLYRLHPARTVPSRMR